MSDKIRHFVYILRCKDGTLYTGYTTDLDERLRQHNGERPGGARYTRTRRPVELGYAEEHQSRAAALVRERAIKRMTRQKKLQMIETWMSND